MAARKPGPAVALDVEGALLHPDLSLFEGTFRGRVKCLTCGKCGAPEEIWVFEHLAGHPHACPEEDCGRVFTRPEMLVRHMRSHGKLYDVREGETDKERQMRFRRAREQRLQEAGREDSAA